MGFTDKELEIIEEAGLDPVDLQEILKYKQTDLDAFVTVDSLDVSIVFPISQTRANQAIATLRSSLNPKGCQVYFSQLGKQEYLLNLLKVDDEFDILRFHGTEAPNYNLLTEDIIERLSEWKKLYGLYIAGANRHWVMFQLENLPEDLDKYVEELVKFCPDYLHQDNYSERGEDWSKFMIRSTINYHRIVRLWWD